MNSFKIRRTLAAIVLSAICCADITAAKGIESFEEGIPQGLRATGQLELDTLRMKDGKHSIRWTWKGNDQLVFDTPIGYRKQRREKADSPNLSTHADPSNMNILETPHGFFMWIYNDEANPQRIRFEFGRGEEVDCWFDFWINFKGWRTVALNYDRGDMKGLPREDMTRLTINAPNTGSGTFHIDTMGFSVPMNPRTVGSNWQLPDIDPHSRLVSQHEHMMHPFSTFTPTFNLEPLTDENIADFRKLERQAMPYWLNEAPYWIKEDRKKELNQAADLMEIERKFALFEIRREGANIYGRPLAMATIIKEYYSENGLSFEENNEGIINWRFDFCSMLFQIAKAWTASESEQTRARLEEVFFDVFDYGYDQGFAPGAGLGWTHHLSYIIREYVPAMFIMREPLERSGRLDIAVETCKWFTGFNRVYREDQSYGWEGRKACDADDMQGLLSLRLLTAMTMKDSPEKARDIKHFSNYFSNVSTAYANALDETFKPDGTTFHHGGHIHGYGGRAIYGSVRTYDILKGTAFEASDEAAHRIKKCARTYFDTMFTDKVVAPKAFASIRFSNYTRPKLYANMLDTMGESYSPLNGYRTLSYSCAGVRRKDNDWMITTRTHSKFVYPFESWGRSFFAFPLFIANGYLDVSYPDSIDSLTPAEGIWHEGIDWRRYPGTTSVRLPYEEIAIRVGKVRDEGGEYLFSDQAFSGGVETSYGCGVHVFQFKGHDKYGLESFTGKKTWFFIGNKVLCLGSEINSAIADHEVETTLFQTPILEGGQNLVLNGNEISLSPFKMRLKNSSWLIDNRGTGYYLPSGKVNITRAKQTNPHWNYNGSDLSGKFATAWIDHGKAPTNAEYEYVLFAGADAEMMHSYAAKPTISVIQKSSAAHVVELMEENATAYAVYAEKGASFQTGPVESVNKQSTFIAKLEGDKLRLSVSDPDLNIYDGQEDLLPDGSRTELSIYEREWFFWPSRPNTVHITLYGEWEIAELVRPMETAQKQPKVLTSEAGKTVVEIECRDGLSTEFVLCR